MATATEETQVVENAPKKRVLKKKLSKKVTPIKSVTPKKNNRPASEPKTAEPKTPATSVKKKKEKTENSEFKSYMKDTLQHLNSLGKSGATRPEVKKATGNKIVGLPQLIAGGYVDDVVVEGQRAHTFTITVEGKKLLKTL